MLQRDGRLLASDVRRARTVAERMRGLIGVAEMPPGTAVALYKTKQVHTFGMRFAIDVLFCDRTGTVLHVVERMRPRRVSRWVPRAEWTFELAARAGAGVRRGDKLTSPLLPASDS